MTAQATQRAKTISGDKLCDKYFTCFNKNSIARATYHHETYPSMPQHSEALRLPVEAVVEVRASLALLPEMEGE